MPARTIDNCSLIKRMGGAKPDKEKGRCVGFARSEADDEPCEICKNCKLNSFYESEDCEISREYDRTGY